VIEQYAKDYDVEIPLVLAIIREESKFDQNAISWAGAIGLMQIIPATGRKIAINMGLTDFDPCMMFDYRTNIRFGMWYLAKLMKHFKGFIPFAVAAYNAGERKVDIWIKRLSRLRLDEFLEQIPFRQTRFYVKRVLKSYGLYRMIQFNEPNPFPTNLSMDITVGSLR
jgi:soluble lytic murein transglycosylase